MEINKGEYAGSIYFSEDTGKFSARTYSYEISSCGEIELTEDETKELYLAMKAYYGKKRGH